MHKLQSINGGFYILLLFSLERNTEIAAKVQNNFVNLTLHEICKRSEYTSHRNLLSRVSGIVARERTAEDALTLPT